MKQLSYFTAALFAVLTITSCTKNDNYAPPDQTLNGRLIDVTTGQPIQLESGGAVIRLEDLTWQQKTGNAPIPQDFSVKADGSFNNTKLFNGNYFVYPINGPFVPHYSVDAGNPIDNRKKMDIKGGVTTVDFQVEPLLKVEWIGEPVINPDKTVSVSFKFTRGTANAFYIKDIDQAWLFISATSLLGNNSRDPNLSNSIVYATTAAGNAAIGTTVTLTSKLPLGSGRPYFVRVGVRTKDNIGARFNYNAPKQVLIP